MVSVPIVVISFHPYWAKFDRFGRIVPHKDDKGDPSNAPALQQKRRANQNLSICCQYARCRLWLRPTLRHCLLHLACSEGNRIKWEGSALTNCQGGSFIPGLCQARCYDDILAAEGRLSCTCASGGNSACHNSARAEERQSYRTLVFLLFECSFRRFQPLKVRKWQVEAFRHDRCGSSQSTPLNILAPLCFNARSVTCPQRRPKRWAKGFQAAKRTHQVNKMCSKLQYIHAKQYKESIPESLAVMGLRTYFKLGYRPR